MMGFGPFSSVGAQWTFQGRLARHTVVLVSTAGTESARTNLLTKPV